MTIPEMKAQIANFKIVIAEENNGKHTYKTDNATIYQNRMTDMEAELAAAIVEEKNRVYLPVAEETVATTEEEVVGA